MKATPFSTLFLGCCGLPAFLLMNGDRLGAQFPSGVQVVAQGGGATGAYLAQSPGPVASSSSAPISVTLGATPSPGDMLVAFVVSATPIPVPTGFSTPISSVAPGPLQVFYKIAGPSAPTSYSLGSGNMLAQLFDITNENQYLLPTVSVDSPSPPTPGQVRRNESILTANGFTLAAFGASSNDKSGWLFTPSPGFVTPSPPGGVTVSPLPQTLYGNLTFALALAVFPVTSEAFTATPNPFLFIGQFMQRPSYGGTAVYNGAVLTVLPAPTSLASPNLATPPMNEFYVGARYNELSGDNGAYDQSTVANFETDISHRLVINSHFHYWTDIFPWANSSSSPYLDSVAAHSPLPASSPYMVPYNQANTDEIDDAYNGRYVLTTWNCGDTDWNVAHGNDDAQIIATAYRFKAYGRPIFVRYFHEMNLESGTDDHTACLDGLAAPTPTGYLGSTANLSGDTTPQPTAEPTALDGYFNAGEWKAAWIHVHDLVRSIAPNVNFVFVPSGGGMSDIHSFQPHMYYPGDQYVEWTGFDEYERRFYAEFDDYTAGSPAPCADGAPTPGPTYYCPNTIYTEVINAYNYTQGTWSTSTPKPLFVAETAATPASQPTWLATDSVGSRSIIAETLGQIYPRIAALAYFDENGTISWVLTGAPSPTPSPSPSPGTGYALFAALAGDASSAPGPTASPLPAATASYTINHGPFGTSAGPTVTAKPSAAPSTGDTLLAALVTADPVGSSSVTVPTGWTVLTDPSDPSTGHLVTAYCIVTAMTCQGLVNYSFGTADGGMVQIFDVKNGNGVTANVPIAATDNPNSFLTGLNVINEQVSNLQTSTTGGFAMAIWSAQATDSVLTYPGGGSSTTRGLDEIFPAYSTVYTFNLNAQLGMESNYVSLESDKINKEIASSQPFTASARYFNNIPSTPASPGPAATGTVNGDGTIIWFPPPP